MRGNAKADIVVIGAGASGLMAAGAAAECGADVVLLERNASAGRKLAITGKGRCNLTNAADVQQMIRNVPGNGKFLYSALNKMKNSDIVDFFNGHGVETVLERGGRVFTKSGKAKDVAVALLNYAKANRARVMTGSYVREVCLTGGEYRFRCDIGNDTDGAGIGNSVISGAEISTGEGVKKSAGNRDCAAIHSRMLIIATGGISYPATGSTGDGYCFAAGLGHTIIPPLPSLVPIETFEDWPRKAAGLSLKNVTLKLLNPDKRIVFEDMGEMLFTHFGISGPLVLSGSRHILEYGFGNCAAVIDLKPALSEEKLYNRLTRDFVMYSRKMLKNSLGDLLPTKLIPVIIGLSGIDGDTPVNGIDREKRRCLVRLLKNLELNVAGARPVAEAIVTSGGVSVSEINPSTMESRIVPGLYFCGEVMDVDAYTGGFNLSIAFATGRLAGTSAAAKTVRA